MCFPASRHFFTTDRCCGTVIVTVTASISGDWMRSSARLSAWRVRVLFGVSSRKGGMKRVREEERPQCRHHLLVDHGAQVREGLKAARDAQLLGLVHNLVDPVPRVAKGGGGGEKRKKHCLGVLGCICQDAIHVGVQLLEEFRVTSLSAPQERLVLLVGWELAHQQAIRETVADVLWIGLFLKLQLLSDLILGLSARDKTMNHFDRFF